MRCLLIQIPTIRKVVKKSDMVSSDPKNKDDNAYLWFRFLYIHIISIIHQLKKLYIHTLSIEF
jgi:hypothetical protein